MSPEPVAGVSLAALLTLLLLAQSCSIRKIALKSIGGALSNAADEYARDEDPELVKGALPFSLKVMETILHENPKDVSLLLSVTKDFTQYAYAFLLPEVDDLEEKDRAAAKTVRDRATHMFLRARGYGIRSIEIRHPGFQAELTRDPKQAVRMLTRPEVPIVFWTAAAWAAAVATGREFTMLPQIPLFEAMMERVLELDDTYGAGTVHSFFITYEMVRLKNPGDRVALAKAHFDRALELSHGLQAGPYVTYAEYVTVAQKDRKEFERLLQLAIKIDPKQDPENQLANVVSQRRARWLLGRADKLFPPAK
jgi:predicted anti-sigma-YlaC factor YlaD